MFGWGKRGAQVPEGWQAAEVRIARLAEEVHAQEQRVAALEARQVAYVAAIAEATDKLHRLVERGRKYAAARARDDGTDAGDGSAGPDGDAFLDAYEQHRRGMGG